MNGRKEKMASLAENVYWDELQAGDWRIYIACTERGLCYVGTPNDSFETLSAWVQAKMPQAKLERREEKVAGLKNGLAAYLRGEAADWRCPLDLRGTDFQRSVWNALMAVRPGETVSYSDIAGQLGRAEAVRAVASAIGANPALVAVPCHRIIGKNGALTGYRGGLPMKERLLRLEREGVAASGAAALAAGDRVAPAR